jgi:hypothetical protein
MVQEMPEIAIVKGILSGTFFKKNFKIIFPHIPVNELWKSCGKVHLRRHIHLFFYGLPFFEPKKYLIISSKYGRQESTRDYCP